MRRRHAPEQQVRVEGVADVIDIAHRRARSRRQASIAWNGNSYAENGDRTLAVLDAAQPLLFDRRDNLPIADERTPPSRGTQR